jgi:hypothetical protein
VNGLLGRKEVKARLIILQANLRFDYDDDDDEEKV